jgi:hypothetical protein
LEPEPELERAPDTTVSAFEPEAEACESAPARKVPLIVDPSELEVREPEAEAKMPALAAVTELEPEPERALDVVASKYGQRMHEASYDPQMEPEAFEPEAEPLEPSEGQKVPSELEPELEPELELQLQPDPQPDPNPNLEPELEPELESEPDPDLVTVMATCMGGSASNARREEEERHILAALQAFYLIDHFEKFQVS